jgi:DNA replication and repair protein RecF
MILEKLRLVNFRNHKDSIFEFDRVNYISGDNGAGKTSVAEAISLIFTLKSFRQYNLKKVINFGSEYFYLNSIINNSGKKYDIKFKYSKKKELFVNNNKENPENYIKDKLLFTYSPENEGILSKNQRDRRNFIDRAIFYTDFNYIELLKNYNKLLEMKKNLLLSERFDRDYLAVINDKLFILSGKISEYRKSWADAINAKLSLNFGDIISDEKFKIVIKQINIDKDILKREIFFKKIIAGAHLDKIYFYLNDKCYEDFASFGQRKTFSLLTLASVLFSIEDLGKNGIILVLDDFEVGLDSKRIGVFKSIFEKYQVIVTGVENRYFKNANNIKL